MKFQALLFAILAMAPSFVFAATDIFARSLREGMRGEDVRALQVVLNTDPESRVAPFGAGSPGNETDYFGPATKQALIKFQEKYRTEVLTPVGLTAGTGFFGEKTRAKASLLHLHLNVSSLIPPAVVAPVVVESTVPPVINFFSAYLGASGSALEITGEHFASRNSVFFGAFEMKDVSSNGTSIKISVPNITPGVYAISVAHSKGKSAEDRVFVITKKNVAAPKIESVVPDRVSRGGTIVLRGSGFAQDNFVRTGAGDLSATLNDDGSLSVHIPEDMMSFVVTEEVGKISIPIWIYVLNENGISNAVRFTLEL
ncbi:MAG: IPT/TIG domain-containing protein [Minisyncoccota bacterium]